MAELALRKDLEYVRYQHSLEGDYLPAIRSLISKDLSEPYSIYVYRYFLYQWAHLCFMVSETTPASTLYTNYYRQSIQMTLP